jgi:hypothetical protein
MAMMNKTMRDYLRPQARYAWGAYAVAALLTCAAILMGWQAQRLYTEEASLSQGVAKIKSERAVVPLPPPSKSETEQRKRWSELQAERDFAWLPLFAALERAGNPDIELLEFHPDKSNGSVLLRGEAKDEAALLDFIEALALNPVFRNVYLSRQKIRKRDRLVTVAFELKAGLATGASAGKRSSKN